MKKYYIFSINREFYEVYKKNTDVLYKTLLNLYNLDINEAHFGISVFNQLCNPINKDIVKNHFHVKESTFQINYDAILKINPSCMILNAENEIPIDFLNLNYYEAPLFMIDFKNKNYFWLTVDKMIKV